MIGLVLSLAQPAQAERVRVKLDGAIRGEHAAFYVAREKGYLRAENIEMTVVEEGGPASNTLYVVARTGSSSASPICRRWSWRARSRCRSAGSRS